MSDLLNSNDITVLLVAIILWSLFWKGLALWHSARRKQAGWFVVFLVVNLLGVLEIIYLFFIAKVRITELFSKDPESNTTPPPII